MGDDDSPLFRADENSQSATSFPESGTSLHSVVSHHVTHVTHAAIRKEDSGDISHCEHSVSGQLSSLLALCVLAPRNTHKIPQGRRFKSGRPHQPTTHTSICDARTIRATRTKRELRLFPMRSDWIEQGLGCSQSSTACLFVISFGSSIETILSMFQRLRLDRF